MGAQPCVMQLGFDDIHGSYEGWTTSFIKYEAINFVDYNGTLSTNNQIQSGYFYLWDAVELDALEFGYPMSIWEFTWEAEQSGASFTIVPGKLNSEGSLMPCEIEEEGSGPCLNPRRPWEMGLTSRDWFVSFFSPETNSWMAPYGSTLTAECSMGVTSWDEPFPFLVPGELKGEARAHNNVKPPSFHVPDPLPHESAEFYLTIADGGGFGWWNTLKYYPNQYVLDDGEKILHRGTLVDKAEDTFKFRLKDGTYYLRMLGNLDDDATDDMWSFGNKDGVVALGGRHDRLTFTVSKGQISSTVAENVMDVADLPVSSSPYPLADFDGLISSANLKSMKDSIMTNIARSTFLHTSDELEVGTPQVQSVPTVTQSMAANPLEASGILFFVALISMVTMYGVMSFFKPSYHPVMDVSSTPTTTSNSKAPSTNRAKSIQMETPHSRFQEC